MNTLIRKKEKQVIKIITIANTFLQREKEKHLLEKVGKIIRNIPNAHYNDKKWFQKSYIIGDQRNDFLAGRGVFYITEERKLFLDATAGHYQMTWGYNHPFLMNNLNNALKTGIAWDCHSNIPGFFVKKLSEKIVNICNPQENNCEIQENENSLNTVLLGIATGSVACSTAMKLAINYFKKTKGNKKKIVFVSLNGNYHGTDFLMQRLRGMWQWIFSENFIFETIEPNNTEGLKNVFEKHGENIAGFFFEPVMMNREAILLDKNFVCEARKLTEAVNALMIIDEIQTCCWYPEIFMYRQFDIVPDIVILGKGLTAGFHPLSCVIYRRKLDSLKQYDAISTNGNAPLPSFMALCCLQLVEENIQKIKNISIYYEEALKKLALEFQGLIVSIQGKGLLSGIKLKDQKTALEFHRRCLEKGIWLRVHAYYQSHSTALTKFALVVSRNVIDFTIEKFRSILKRL